MGGKGSGRKPLYNDRFHKLWRYQQRQYDREIRAIMKKRGCSYKDAQKIRMERKREKARKEWERKLKEAERYP